VCNVPLAKQTNEFVEAVYAEATGVMRERGLPVPAGAGSLAVAAQVERLSLRQELLDSAVEGAQLYIDTIGSINEFRTRKNRIPTLQAEDYAERAEGLLTDRMVLAARHLPVTADRRLLLIPRLNRPITRDENVGAWKSAAGDKLLPWAYRTKILKRFTVDQLSGFDPAIGSHRVEFEVVPTAEDIAQKGNVRQQNYRLQTLRNDFPEIHVTALFHGAILARRHKGKSKLPEDSYVRAINLRPLGCRGGDDCVPDAYVSESGTAEVGVNDVKTDEAARLLVRN